ncbi:MULTISPECIES: AMP-binding protein [unclassified Oceanispirochaeta]|uniref:AMP-binding protein n=1 Tax=unclassified Oceanispirochaeta TaxID=2635722 RepID=UPI00131423B2|nr:MULTISPECIES: AMP-binding protein [unclassified Oceanispirochaeta]MBF9015543.1 AMP-binding protein [Oceanispirochaeta sp. M2]NPD73968.1 AMP-binding protein [Oceanispirochaeta sp. M1]
MPFKLTKNTIEEFHKEILNKYEKRPFLYFVDDEPITYGEYGVRVEKLRQKMANSGLLKADAVILLGPASPNWAIAFMSIMSAGLVVVPVMEDFPATDMDHIIKDSGAAAAFIAPSYKKKEGFPSLKDMLLFSLDDLEVLDKGKKIKNRPAITAFSDDNGYVDYKADEYGCYPVEPSDVAELLYTSGTTGHSKAVMLTHNNLVTNLYLGTDLIDDCFDEQGILLSLLPMAHSFGSTSAFLSTMYKGPRICFLKRKPTPEYLQIVFQKVRPTILGGVPLIFEKIFQKKITPLIESKKVLKWAIEHSSLARKGFYRVAGKGVLDYFGGKLKCIIIGGANFSTQVETFMVEGKIPYVLGYGLSETSPLITFSSLQDARFGSVGKAVLDTELRITNPDSDGTGDIEVKGPQIMKGYYRLPEETAAVFTDDGFFKTGDRGFVDDDGYLFIRGRSKNVIIGSSGENIYPEVIEIILASYSLVEESIVYLDDDKLTALVYPDQENLSVYSSTEDQNFLDEMEQIRKDLNQKLPVSSRIVNFKYRTEAFEKTPTKKIKRGLYIEGY